MVQLQCPYSSLKTFHVHARRIPGYRKPVILQTAILRLQQQLLQILPFFHSHPKQLTSNAQQISENQEQSAKLNGVQINCSKFPKFRIQIEPFELPANENFNPVQ